MNVSILIVTHARDVHWLLYCLRSIAKYAAGFTNTVIVCPESDTAVIESECVEFFERIGFEFVEVSDAPAGRGHLHMEYLKCMADTFCPNADFIMHVDSDCIFTEPVTPAAYFKYGKPVLLIESWESIARNKRTELCWREATRLALGLDTGYETMRRIPMVFRRDTYGKLRDRVDALHEMTFKRYVMTRRNIFPYGFSEFNALGGYALEWQANDPITGKGPLGPVGYHAIIVDDGKNHPHNPLLQMWSHIPSMDTPVKVWHEGKLITIVPTEEIERALARNDQAEI